MLRKTIDVAERVPPPGRPTHSRRSRLFSIKKRRRHRSAKSVDNRRRTRQKQTATSMNLLLVGDRSSLEEMLLVMKRTAQQHDRSNRAMDTYRIFIRQTCLRELKSFINTATQNMVHVESKNQVISQKVCRLSSMTTWDGVVSHNVAALYADKALKTVENKLTSKHRNSVKYWRKNISRVADPKYQPTIQDIILSRSIITGIEEEYLQFPKISFKTVTLLGDQETSVDLSNHCERFQVVVYCVDVSQFDKKNRGKKKQDSLGRTLDDFNKWCNSIEHCNTPFILLFTGIESFSVKLRSGTDFGKYFEGYEGAADDVEKALKHIREQFRERNYSSHLVLPLFVRNHSEETIQSIIDAIHDCARDD